MSPDMVRASSELHEKRGVVACKAEHCWYTNGSTCVNNNQELDTWTAGMLAVSKLAQHAQWCLTKRYRMSGSHLAVPICYRIRRDEHIHPSTFSQIQADIGIGQHTRLHTVEAVQVVHMSVHTVTRTPEMWRLDHNPAMEEELRHLERGRKTQSRFESIYQMLQRPKSAGKRLVFYAQSGCQMLFFVVCLFKVGCSTDQLVYLKRSFTKVRKKGRKKRKKHEKEKIKHAKNEGKEQLNLQGKNQTEVDVSVLKCSFVAVRAKAPSCWHNRPECFFFSFYEKTGMCNLMAFPERQRWKSWPHTVGRVSLFHRHQNTPQFTCCDWGLDSIKKRTK